jgi:hypothetical protein
VFTAFGRFDVPQSPIGAVPSAPPWHPSSGSTAKSGFRASNTVMSRVAFLERNASNSASDATPGFRDDIFLELLLRTNKE